MTVGVVAVCNSLAGTHQGLSGGVPQATTVNILHCFFPGALMSPETALSQVRAFCAWRVIPEISTKRLSSKAKKRGSSERAERLYTVPDSASGCASPGRISCEVLHRIYELRKRNKYGVAAVCPQIPCSCSPSCFSHLQFLFISPLPPRFHEWLSIAAAAGVLQLRKHRFECSPSQRIRLPWFPPTAHCFLPVVVFPFWMCHEIRNACQPLKQRQLLRQHFETNL